MATQQPRRLFAVPGTQQWDEELEALKVKAAESRAQRERDDATRELEWRATHQRIHDEQQERLAAMPPAVIPVLPSGHKLLTEPDQARLGRKWEAEDERGYKYVVGERRTRWGNRVVEAHWTDAWGKDQVEYELPNGNTTRERPPTYRDDMLAALPVRLRHEPWSLGGHADESAICRKWAKAVLEGRPSSLWLAGQPGRGKTQFAHWLRLELATHNVVSDFRPTAELAAELRATYNLGKRDHDERHHFERLIKQCCEVAVLVLDDVGAESNSDDVRALLFRIVNHRWENNLPTVATSNAMPEQLQANGMDGRLASRFASYFTVVLKGTDHRKVKL